MVNYKEPVAQKDVYGCSVACVAYILGLKYKNAKKLFSNSSYAKTRGFLCKDIINALKRKGLDYQYKRTKPKIKTLIYKSNNIVFIARSKKYPAGHYLCRTKDKKWMDPWINFPSDIKKAKSGFRKRLPCRAIYGIFSA